MVEPLKPRPWGHAINSDDSFGTWLRRQREVREISLREIAETSKISIRYLEALEQDRFDLMPAPLFAKGFLREYAKFVGLDADEVINYYLAANGVEEEVEATPREKVASATSGYTWYLVGGVVLVFALVGLMSWYLRQQEPVADDQPGIAAPAATAEVPDLVEQPVATTVIDMTLDFTDNCWVEAFVDGERVRSELRVQGESIRFQANEEVRVVLGNVAGAVLEVNGKSFPIGVADGEAFVVDAAFLAAQEGS